MRLVNASPRGRFRLSRRFGAMAIVVTIAVVVAGALAVRLSASEDDWICSRGQWIAHGHPEGSAPTGPCR